MDDRRQDHDPTALPSGKALLFAFIALVAAVVLAAWILSSQHKRAEPAPGSAAVPLPPRVAVPAPPPLQPTAAWNVPAGIVDDAHAVSALMLAFDGNWSDSHRHVLGMYRAIASGDVRAARKSNEAGLTHFRAGDYASAARAFELAIQADRSEERRVGKECRSRW